MLRRPFPAFASQSRSLRFPLVAVAVALLFGISAGFDSSRLARFDRWLLDTLLAKTASGAPANDVAVVDIEDVSLSALGQWPWPRYRIAQLIDRIAAAHPAAIATDIVFPEPDRTSLADLQKTYKRDFDVDVSIEGVPPELFDNDGFLGNEMASANVVGARYFYFDHTTPLMRTARPGLGFVGRLDLMTLEQARGVLENVDAIASQTRVTGFLNSQLDDDGVLRRLPLLMQGQGVVHPSLALAATMQSLGVTSAQIEKDARGFTIHVGSRRVPVDGRGYAWLRFNGPSDRYLSIPAVDVLSGRVSDADLRGKIVFLGSSAAGLRDVHRTAVDPFFSGLKIQAVMAQNILDGTAAYVPAWTNQVALLAGLLIALVFSSFHAARCRLTMILAVSASAGAALFGAVAIVFTWSGAFLPASAPMSVLGTLTLLSAVIRIGADYRRAQRWRKQLENARQVAIESMAAVAETRDPETGAHIKRTQHYVRAIAKRLRETGRYSDTLTKEYIHLLFLSAPLHDIGKVGVPDHILLKPGPLTADELKIMRQHAEFGRKIIISSANYIEGDNFLMIAGDIAGTHHEKWDGTGYPEGLRGQDIPLSGRIMAVADIYDALISERCYKSAFPHEKAKALMQKLRGTTFDPVVVDAFFEIEVEVLQIATRFKDNVEEPMHDSGKDVRYPVQIAAPAAVTEHIDHITQAIEA